MPPIPATPLSAPVRVAVVGLGFMGVTHLRAYLNNPLAQVVAVCDEHRLPVNGVLSGVTGNIQKAADIQLGAAVKVYRTLAGVLGDPEVQLIDLCTPTPVHAEQAIAALRAGRHVLCEKPLARTAAEARAVLEVAADSPGFLMPAMCMRFWPGWSWLKQVVTEAVYGRVLAARFQRVSEMPAWSRSGTYAGGGDPGGALSDLHIHDTDFVNHLFGRPASVFSSGVIGPTGVINHVFTHYDYPGGPAVCAEGSWLLTAGFNMAYTIYCERATLDYDLARGTSALLVTETNQAARTVALAATDGYAGETDYFVECVARQRAPSLVTGSDALTALELCEAEAISLRSHAVTKLEHQQSPNNQPRSFNP